MKREAKSKHDMPDVGQERECLIACRDAVTHVVGSVVRHFEAGDGEISYAECFFFPDKAGTFGT